MKTFKKYLAAVLALLMVTTACPATVLADTVYTNTDAGAVNDYCIWSYTAEDKTLYINKDGVLTGDADKKLPLYFEDGSYWSYTGWSRLVFGKDITKIEELEVFADKGAAVPVDIEFEDGSVCKELGDNVFKFGNASSFKFPDSLEVIGIGCFCGLFKERNSVSITLPSGVKSIGDGAFTQCGLDTVTIPDYTGEGVRVFGNALFEDASINSITMGTGNTEIPDDCFNRSDLVSFTVPEGITRIGYRAFQYCENLVRVTFPDSIENIDNTSFQQTSVNSVVIPDNGKAIRIGNYTFENCKNLASVTFPNSLETTVELGDNSFRNCTSLVNLTITASVRKMGSNAFQHTYKLKNLTFKAIETDEGYVGLDTVGFGAFESSTVKNVTFCESITTLDSYSFNSCVNIEGVGIN